MEIKKTENQYKEKTLSAPLGMELKAEGDSRSVKGYFSAFNVIDSDGDMIMPGAFSKSINDRGPLSSGNRKIAHLAFHDTRRPVGTITELKEDEKGLYFESTIGTHSEGENAWKMYKEGVIREHSIGFRYLWDKAEFVAVEEGKIEALLTAYPGSDVEAIKTHGGYYKLNEVKLYEGSFVTFGANPETPNETKSEEEIKQLFEELEEKSNLFLSDLKKITSADPVKEQEFLQLLHSYKSLALRKPSIKDTQKEQADEPKSTFLSFIK